MDVAAYHWATLQMGPASPTSEKAAKHMKNIVILVAKHCKKKKRERSEKEGITVSFFPSVLSSSSSRHGH
jgi:hypothetical protein